MTPNAKDAAVPQKSKEWAAPENKGAFPKKYALAAAAVLIMFSVGLVLYFEFSAGYGDGLEKTMEGAGVEEKEPFYTAPLSYGEDYAAALGMGIVGFCATLGAVYAYGKLSKRKEPKGSERTGST